MLMMNVGLALLLGLAVGSFLNVVIYRLPIMLERSWQKEAQQLLGLPETASTPAIFNLCVPASACPHCHRPIKPWQNIPLLSFVFLRGKCAYCRAPISWRYPAVELLTGVAFAVVVWRLGVTPIAGMGLLLTAALIALAFIDMDTQLLPDQITLPLIWLGLLMNLYFAFVPLQQAVWGAVVGYMALWLLFHLFKWITGKEGMGYGDFKLLSALGAWLGVSTLPVMIILAALVGIVASIVLKVARNQPMAFGPALAISGWLAFVFSDPLMRLIHWWLQLSGFVV